MKPFFFIQLPVTAMVSLINWFLYRNIGIVVGAAILAVIACVIVDVATRRES